MPELEHHKVKRGGEQNNFMMLHFNTGLAKNVATEIHERKKSNILVA